MKMERSSQNQKESGVSRIVGVEKNIEEDLLSFFKAEFESEQKDAFEKEHSNELDNIIDAINNHFQDFLKKYGINSISIPAKNIHVVDQEKLTPQQVEELKQRYDKENGFYIPSEQHIGMLIQYDDHKLAFLQTLIHEMLHLNSFLSFQKLSVNESVQGHQLTKKSENGEEENISLGMRRMGFRIQTACGETFFDNIDEAIITELTMRFDWKYFSQISELEPELKKNKNR